ncbi:MAG TPA: aspartate 1-decarboxylase [Ignavibacteria bacterium]
MFRTMCKSKIHRVTVTQAELYYEGSLTLDKALMDAADLKEYEKIQVMDINNGSRFETYLIEGPADSGVVCLNGAAERLASVGDEIIIISYGEFTEEELIGFKPIKIFVDKKNKITEGQYSPKIYDI